MPTHHPGSARATLALNTYIKLMRAGEAAFGTHPPGALDWRMHSPVRHDIAPYPTVTRAGVGVYFNPSKPNWVYDSVVFARP